MTINSYLDMRNLTSPLGELGSCPVSGCTTLLGKASSQWGDLPYCPVHRIRIHGRTFVYYDETSQRNASLRNILFETEYFSKHILGNAAKAETHRICHETSEDALTWNVFSRLASGRMLSSLLSSLTGISMKGEPELYLWGLKVGLNDSSKPILFSPLKCARDQFEKGVAKFLTEPDVILFVPGQLLVLVEAKFTSGNTIASGEASDDVSGAKPKSREGVLKRYATAGLPGEPLLLPSSLVAFYSQLYRNLVFASYMANNLSIEWALINLVCEKQFRQNQKKIQYQDPTQSIRTFLPDKSRDQFLLYTWERLYADHVAKSAELKDLAEYMYNKSANNIKALSI
jgi:hypothetical protein